MIFHFKFSDNEEKRFLDLFERQFKEAEKKQAIAEEKFAEYKEVSNEQFANNNIGLVTGIEIGKSAFWFIFFGVLLFRMITKRKKSFLSVVVSFFLGIVGGLGVIFFYSVGFVPVLGMWADLGLMIVILIFVMVFILHRRKVKKQRRASVEG